jgi:hypothetical protein
MQPFSGYLGPVDQYYKDKSGEFFFIGINTKENGDNLTAIERNYFDEEIRNAKTDEEKNRIIEAKNVPESSSGLKGVFFVFLFGTILLFWSVPYTFIIIGRWIRQGFKEGNSA